MSAEEERAKTAAAVELLGALPVPVGPGSQVSELEHLRKSRDAFRDQCNAVFQTNQRLVAEVQESDQARLRAENETRTVKREADVLRARVAELEAVLAVERARHTQYEDSPHCRLDGEFWPCQTVAAIDSGRQPGGATAAEVDRCHEATEFDHECCVCRPSPVVSASRLTAFFAPTQAYREEAAEAPALTVYRASHDSIVFGLYTTAAAAREHCEAYERRDQPTAELDWIEDEEDGVAELVAAVDGNESETGYVVTALEVASAYDEEADE